MPTKSRHFALIVYPESAPDSWMLCLEDLHIPAAVSPLHTPDGVELKDHFHVLLSFPGPTTLGHVSSITDVLCGSRPISVHSLAAYYRYLTHLDSPDKQQWPLDVVPTLFSGFVPPDGGGLTFSQYMAALREWNGSWRSFVDSLPPEGVEFAFKWAHASLLYLRN